MTPGVSFIVRARNDEATLHQCLSSLTDLQIPHEIIVILHLCTDGSREIAETFPNTTVHEYAFPLSRPGFEMLATPDDSKHSFAYYSNWCFNKGRYSWKCGFDADLAATPAMINFYNSRKWDDAQLKRIKVNAVDYDGYICNGNHLTNAGNDYGKHIFWEYNRAMFKSDVVEEQCHAAITHMSRIGKKPYWKEDPWFMFSNNDIKKKYNILTEMFGPEPIGMAAASNPECDRIAHLVVSKEDVLKQQGINFWF